ncbi:GNAT family N-acetyltransferase [Evansella cellulosilytica]|uniref:GCN5-related N-acetyltransferase n=1 Tax=Evansella cellulosilytica (strain ATCC 21833 / DSM 2522 / FERM P-1141 / JCM 9156 / N-4) TaxID=649639 RepID=E6TXU7_EVAC2|nr:GNAT family protein [Evansella cellulosilytica]ADU30023.1 GCN5-related N-acetyltransferase [Evansella cellulosilytica DSM 2522]
MIVLNDERLQMKGTTKDNSQVILRPAEEKDAFDIIKNVQDIVQEGRYIQKEKVRTVEEEKRFIQQMTAEDHMYTAVEINGEVVGIARLVRGELKMKRHTAIFRTWLSKSAQGKGLGNILMRYTLEWGKKHHLHKICLTVFSSNQIAKKLYDKYGFVVEGIQREQVYIDGEFEDEIFMAYFFN